VGFVGELYIAGDGVTRGYLNRPEANAAAFLPNPFRPGETFYKTGDMVRWLPDGTLEFLGRVDHQVKVRGYRIELGAIEGAIASHPQVADTAVVVKEVDTRKKIVAYYKPRGAEVAGSELRAWLEDQFPSYMIPNLLLPLAEIPMNPNGKVDRRQLELMPVNASQHVDFAAPTTLPEIKMARVWESALGVDGVGLNDEFAELGGHSLLAMPLVQRVNEQFGTSLAIGALYEHPTVAKLLAHASRESAEAQPSNLIRFPDPGRKAQPAARLRPLFMVHGLGGHLASFYPLVRNLKQSLHEQHRLDITVYGLEANGFREGQQHFQDLDQMVAAYVHQIREVQPHGPYLLGGWSYGVSIAFHIAQELIRSGDEVGLFISIDAEAPNVPKDFEAFIAEHGILSLDDLYEEGRLKTLLARFGRRFGFVCRDDEPARQQFHRFLGYAHGHGAQPVDADLERHGKVAIANLFNARGFKPRPIAPLNTVLVRASGSRFDNYLGDWASLVDSRMLASLTLAGDHWSIMQDPELAAQLATQLALHAAPAAEPLAA
jgi:thioesterase domain-containing protein